MKHLTLVILLALAPLSWGKDEQTLLCITNWDTTAMVDQASKSRGSPDQRYVVSASTRTFKVQRHGGQKTNSRWKLMVNNKRTIVAQQAAANIGAGLLHTWVIDKQGEPSITFAKTRISPTSASSQVGTCTEL